MSDLRVPQPADPNEYIHVYTLVLVTCVSMEREARNVVECGACGRVSKFVKRVKTCAKASRDRRQTVARLEETPKRLPRGSRRRQTDQNEAKFRKTPERRQSIARASLKCESVARASLKDRQSVARLWPERR